MSNILLGVSYVLLNSHLVIVREEGEGEGEGKEGGGGGGEEGGGMIKMKERHSLSSPIVMKTYKSTQITKTIISG